jgi:hypothetical protein
MVVIGSLIKNVRILRYWGALMNAEAALMWVEMQNPIEFKETEQDLKAWIMLQIMDVLERAQMGNFAFEHDRYLNFSSSRKSRTSLRAHGKNL